MNIVTLDQLVNISKVIIGNVEINEEFNLLLDESISNQFDILEGKKQLLDLFSKFNSARYLYDFPIEQNVKISPNYELHESSHQRIITSQVENAIERYVDKQLLTTEIYNSIIKLSYKLTNDESIYLLNTFFKHKSEEEISEIIGISKTYLQKIKKSCIVKMWIELKCYCENDN